MIQDEIIEMAKEAHISAVFPASEKSLERFANLVAAKEREACAKVCEKTFFSIHADQAIRARGEA